MADNISVTQGTGTTVATDEIGGVHYQKIKIFDATADSSTGAKVGANGLEVDVKTSALPSGAATAANQTSIIHEEDSAHSSGDKGVMALAVKETDDYSASQAGTDGDYTSLSTDYGGWLRTKGQALFLIDSCSSTSGFSVLGNDTDNLTTATQHLAGSASISFDKVNGADNKKIAGVQKTLGTTIDFFKVAGVIGYLQSMVYLSDISNCDYFFIRLGSDSSNYNEWRVNIGDAWTAGVWNTVKMPVSETNYAGSTGNGWDPNAVDYLAFGVAFDSESDTLSGILVDRVLFTGGIMTSTDITANITSDINSANINVLKVGNKSVNTGAGNVGTGTQRITIADDDTNLSKLGGAVSGSEMQVDVVGALPAGTNTIGKLGANSGVDIGDVDVTSCANTTGNVAHDSADSGNPVKIGGKAYNQDGTTPGTAVAEGDRTHFITDVYGRQFVEISHPNLWKATDNQSTAQTNTQLKAAPGAGLSLYITDLIVSNGATAGNIKFVEDTAGTPVDVIEVIYLAANGGFVTNFKTPLKITANKDFGYTSATVTTHSVTVLGYIAP